MNGNNGDSLTAAYAIPVCPPPSWFPDEKAAMTEDAYHDKVRWVLPRLHLLCRFTKGDSPCPDLVAGAAAMREVCEDRLAAWIVCCSLALDALTYLPRLPEWHHWAIERSRIPLDVLTDAARLAADLAGELLTMVSRNILPPPLEYRDNECAVVSNLIAILLAALEVARDWPAEQQVAVAVASA